LTSVLAGSAAKAVAATRVAITVAIVFMIISFRLSVRRNCSTYIH